MRVIGGEFRVLGLRGQRQKNPRNYPFSNKKGYWLKPDYLRGTFCDRTSFWQKPGPTGIDRLCGVADQHAGAWSRRLEQWFRNNKWREYLRHGCLIWPKVRFAYLRIRSSEAIVSRFLRFAGAGAWRRKARLGCPVPRGAVEIQRIRKWSGLRSPCASRKSRTDKHVEPAGSSSLDESSILSGSTEHSGKLSGKILSHWPESVNGIFFF